MRIPLIGSIISTLVVALVVVGIFTVVGNNEKAEGREVIANLMSLQVASGGGANIKLLPNAKGEAIVPMTEVFSFDKNHAICWVETNRVAFVMPTFSMGQVPIAENGFFMSMVADTFTSHEITTDADGNNQVVMEGGLACNTEITVGTTVFGDKSASEPANYRIVAVDKGKGGGQAGDTFAFTVFFNETSAPLNHAIFGPEFTFTGEMNAGEITIGLAHN